MPQSTVNWYGETVKAQTKQDGKKALLALAFQIEGQAKINITNNGQVDTGFMRNSVYVSGGGASSYGNTDASGLYPSPKTGEDENRELGPELTPPADDVYVVVGAAYAIYQETQQSFLYQALEQVAGSNADVTIKRAAR